MAPELLVVAPNAGSPFVVADVAALGETFSVELLARDRCRSGLELLSSVARSARGGTGAILLWFLAPAYALQVMAVARRHRIPVAVMTGGLDVDYVPELGLGGLRLPHNRLRQRLGLRHADLVLAMSEYSAARIRSLARPRRLEVVTMGVDTARFSPEGPRDDLALTICWSITAETARLKGVTTFVEAARLVPETRFVLLGRAGGDGELARLRACAPANVTFAEQFLPDGELVALLRRTKAYVQVSAHEGFGLAAAEAMACGAIVVGAGAHALREVVGETGPFVPYGDAAATADAIRAALAAGDAERTAARARIVERFSFAARRERLTELLRPLVAGGRPSARRGRAGR